MSIAGTLARPWLRLVDFRQYVPMAIVDPQPLVDLTWQRGTSQIDVTTAMVVASLRPLTFAINGVTATPSVVVLRERLNRRAIGEIMLAPVHDAANNAGQRPLFTVGGSSNHLLPAARFAAYSAFERFRVAREQRRHQHNFRLEHGDLLALLLFYACPRPVVLVTVAHGSRVNMFPMDLIGPTSERGFSLALRSTSASIGAIRDTRRVAIASMTLADKAQVYALGRFHRLPHIEPNDLPFALASSSLFSLPVVATSPRVRELEIDDVREVGSHTLFHATVASDTGPAAIPVLHHVSGLFAARRLVDASNVFTLERA